GKSPVARCPHSSVGRARLRVRDRAHKHGSHSSDVHGIRTWQRGRCMLLHRPRRMKGWSAELDGDELCKIGERAGAVALHALKLDDAAAAETDQHVAIERAADCNAVAIRL